MSKKKYRKEQEELLKALQERLLRLEDQYQEIAKAPDLSAYESQPKTLGEAMLASGKNNPANNSRIEREAAELGLTPEEYNYIVEISKRDVFRPEKDPKTGQQILRTIGWDKR